MTPLTSTYILYVGDADELVPASHMRSLYNFAANCCDKDFYSVRNGTHNDTFEVAGIEYYQRLRKFAQKLMQNTTISSTTGSSIDNNEAENEEVKERKMVSPTAVIVEDGNSGSSNTGTGSSSGSTAGLDEEGYLLVEADANVALPTMTTNFQVK